MAGVAVPLHSGASTSTPPPPLCAVCNYRYSIYTCPRCSTRTCSLLCSTAHKSANECTGERNKVAYVPANKYGWGSMMDDYVFLEDVGRRVGDWGKEIVRGGYGMGGPSAGRGQRGQRGGRRGRGARGHGSSAGRTGGRTKRDLLKIQLEARDIDMDLLPVGMERRKINQSSWDFRNCTALLTIEFKIHPPLDSLAPSSQPRDPPFVLLTHKNSINTPLLSLIRAHMAERASSKKESIYPEWIKSFLCADPDDPDSFTPPQCVMAAQLDPRAVVLSARAKTAYYRFDPSQTLAILLRNTHFVEFPTIELWEEFRGIVVDTSGSVTQQPVEEENRPKRRKLAAVAGKNSISGLLGGYGSDGDENAGDTHNVLSTLEGYAGSDEDVGISEDSVMHIDSDEHREEAANGDSDDEGNMDPAVLLEMVRQAQGNEKWAEIVGEDDQIDWGDSGEDGYE